VTGLELTSRPAGHKRPSALIAFKAPQDEDISRYDWIHIGGAGPDSILAALAGTDGDPVLTRTIGAMGRQMGEYVLSYALAWLQGQARRAAFQERGEWRKEESLPRYLFDQDIAIIGTGPIGRGVAEMLSPLARSVTGYSRRGLAADGFTACRRLSAFEGGDIVIAALPATRATDSLLSDGFFERMSGGLFLNIGRGSVVEEGALQRALGTGRVGHAVLDVFREEPLPKHHWAWSHPRLTVTPHISGVTRPEDIAAAFEEKLPPFLRGSLTSEVDRREGYGYAEEALTVPDLG
jgi:phosphoglycerate dehydrogenase-like enzyme